jgi:hypothetical protein
MCVTLLSSSLVTSHFAADAQSVSQSVLLGVQLLFEALRRNSESTVFFTFPNFRKSFFCTKIPRFNLFLLLRKSLKMKSSMEHSRNDTDVLTAVIGEKHVPLSLCPPQNPQGIDRARSQAAAVRGRRRII